MMSSQDSTAKTLAKLEKKASGLQDTDKSDDKSRDAYVAIIARAILSSKTGKMTLGDIYNHVRENHSCYDNDEKGWRNSIRHNLSVNECFVKDDKQQSGKCHYWAIHENCLRDFRKGDFRRRQARRRARGNVKSISAAPPNGYVTMKSFTSMSQISDQDLIQLVDMNMMLEPNMNVTLGQSAVLPGPSMPKQNVVVPFQPFQKQNTMIQDPSMHQQNTMIQGLPMKQSNPTLPGQYIQQTNWNTIQQPDAISSDGQTSFMDFLMNL